MRTLRLMTALGLFIGACAFAAPVASACLLQSFGPGAGAGGTVRPNDPVSFTAHAIGTDESPGASPWQIDVGGVVVASGTAVPDAGHEWTGSGAITMPDLGAYKRTVTVTIRFTDSGMSNEFSVNYDGTPASTPQQPAPVSNPAPPAASGSPPGSTSQPVSAPSSSPPPATRAMPRPRQPHVLPSHAPSPSRPAPKHPATPAVHTTRPAPAAVTAPRSERVSTPIVPIAVARTEPARARTPHARVAMRHRSQAKVATRAVPRGVATEPVVSAARLSARAAQVGGASRTPVYGGAALLLALLAGGGGLAAAMARRRRDIPEPPDACLAEMEAELQEMLAEEKLRAGDGARPREPV